MPEEIELIENANALEEKLREILIAGSLYRIFAYTGEACHFASSGGTYSAVRRYGALPKQLEMPNGNFVGN